MKTIIYLIIGLVGFFSLNSTASAESSRYRSDHYRSDFMIPPESVYASGVRHAIVSRVQVAMEQRGYYVGLNTGEFVYDTRRAIRRFQIKHGLPVSGKIDEELLTALGVR